MNKIIGSDITKSTFEKFSVAASIHETSQPRAYNFHIEIKTTVDTTSTPTL